MDDVKLTLLLCDVCDEEFDSIQSVDPQRNTIPVNVVKEGGIISGGEVPAWNEAEFATVHKKYRCDHTGICRSVQSGSRI